MLLTREAPMFYVLFKILPTFKLFHSAVTTMVFYVSSTLRMYQYAMFVDLINCRYALINQFIDDVYDDGDNRMNLEPSTSQEQDSSSVHLQQLQDIRQICRALHTASQRVNEVFPVSLALCIFYDFFTLFICSYQAFKIVFLTSKSVRFSSVAFSVLAALASANNLWSMISVCKQTVDQVRMGNFFNTFFTRNTSHCLNKYFDNSRQNVFPVMSSNLLS